MLNLGVSGRIAKGELFSCPIFNRYCRIFTGFQRIFAVIVQKPSVSAATKPSNQLKKTSFRQKTENAIQHFVFVP